MTRSLQREDTHSHESHGDGTAVTKAASVFQEPSRPQSHRGWPPQCNGDHVPSPRSHGDKSKVTPSTVLVQQEVGALTRAGPFRSLWGFSLSSWALLPCGWHCRPVYDLGCCAHPFSLLSDQEQAHFFRVICILKLSLNYTGQTYCLLKGHWHPGFSIPVPKELRAVSPKLAILSLWSSGCGEHNSPTFSSPEL